MFLGSSFRNLPYSCGKWKPRGVLVLVLASLSLMWLSAECCSRLSAVFVNVQWASVTPVAGDPVLVRRSRRKMVSAVVVHAQSWLGTDQMWTPVSVPACLPICCAATHSIAVLPFVAVFLYLCSMWVLSLESQCKVSATFLSVRSCHSLVGLPTLNFSIPGHEPCRAKDWGPKGQERWGSLGGMFQLPLLASYGGCGSTVSSPTNWRFVTFQGLRKSFLCSFYKIFCWNFLGKTCFALYTEHYRPFPELSKQILDSWYAWLVGSQQRWGRWMILLVRFSALTLLVNRKGIIEPVAVLFWNLWWKRIDDNWWT